MNNEITNSTGIERLRTLYSVLTGVPEERTSLVGWVRGPRAGCETTYCAIGWAAIYPEFVKLGLTMSGYEPVLVSPSGEERFKSWGAVEEFFGLGYDINSNYRECYALFTDERETRSFIDADRVGTQMKMSDKALVLMRIRNYLLSKGAITPERSEELKLQERATAKGY